VREERAKLSRNRGDRLAKRVEVAARVIAPSPHGIQEVRVTTKFRGRGRIASKAEDTEADSSRGRAARPLRRQRQSRET